QVVGPDPQPWPELPEAEPVERAQPPAESRARRTSEPRSVHPEPAARPSPQAPVQVAPRGDPSRDGLGIRAEAVRSGLVALDQSVGEQPGKRDAHRVLADREEPARGDEGTHGHGATPERRQEIEDEGPGRGRRHGRSITATGCIVSSGVIYRPTVSPPP